MSEEEHEWALPGRERLVALTAEGAAAELEWILGGLPAPELRYLFGRLSEEERTALLELLSPELAARILEQITEEHAVGVIEDLSPLDAAAIVNELPSADQADIMGRLDESDAEQILAHMEPEEAEDVRLLTRYPSDVAGGLMVTEFLRFPEQATIGEVVAELQRGAEEFAGYDVQYVYVVGSDGLLAGVLPLRSLLIVPPGKRVSELMIRNPVVAREHDSLEALSSLFAQHRFLGVPVVDERGAILGVLRRFDVDAAVAEQYGDQFLKSQGIVGGEELRTMPFFVRSGRRLSWLGVNICLNLVAASVIAAHQETLEAVIALAVFLPMISDMSGCSGNQAVAVSIRELALGVLRPLEIARVVRKEVLIGVFNGLCLGTVVALIAWVWKGNPYLGAVVGGALAINTTVAVTLGGSLPLVIKHFGFDPAIASGPILTTVTDMCGFFLALTFAAALLPALIAG